MPELTEAQHNYAHQRWLHSLWYAYGRNDGSGKEYVDAIHFADFCRQEAIEYVTEVNTALDSIEAQFRRFAEVTV